MRCSALEVLKTLNIKKKGGITMAFKLKSNMKNWDKNIHLHGLTMNDFYRAGVPGLHEKLEELSKNSKKNKSKKGYIPCWVKVTFMIHQFYMDTRNQKKQADYFVSTRSIHERLKGYGNTYCLRTIQKSIAKAKAYGLIREEKFEATEEEKALHPDEDKLYAGRRKLIPNLAMIEDLISIYDEKDDIIMAHLPAKDPLKKLIRCRPYSNVKNIEDKYKLYTKPGTRRKPYSDSTGMYMTWVMNTSSKYYRTDKLTNKFIPTTLDNEQELVDKAYILRANQKYTLSDDEIELIGTIELDVEKASIFNGYYVPSKYRESLQEKGFSIKSNGIINGWKRKSREYTTNGFETL